MSIRFRRTPGWAPLNTACVVRARVAAKEQDGDGDTHGGTTNANVVLQASVICMLGEDTARFLVDALATYRLAQCRPHSRLSGQG